jgi:hypothetical protein
MPPKKSIIGPNNPWYYAHEKGNLFICPEDIKGAIDSGGLKLEIWEIVLSAIGEKQVEDATLCAFIAHHYLKDQ